MQCRAGQGNLAVCTNGRFYPCHRFAVGRYVMGNVFFNGTINQDIQKTFLCSHVKIKEKHSSVGKIHMCGRFHS